MRAARVKMAVAAAGSALVVLVAAGPTVSAAAPAGPSPKQIATAVATAKRSRSLWATINICSSRRYPNALGVRGQMPTLGFPASLSMMIQINYWNATRQRFVAIHNPAARTTLTLGQESHGLQQDGAVFPFGPHTGLLDATVTFTWTRHGKVIGRARRRTTAGHPQADYGSPPRFSAAHCRIP